MPSGSHFVTIYFSLFKKDFLNLVELVELKDISIVIREVPSTQQQSPASLRMPAIIPKKVDIRDFNLIVRGENGDLEVRNLRWHFSKARRGIWPANRFVSRLSARGISSAQVCGIIKGKLELTDLGVRTDFRGESAASRFVRLRTGKISPDLDGKALQSSVSANITYEQPADTPFVNASLELTGLELSQIQKLSPIPISGSISKIDVQTGR